MDPRKLAVFSPLFLAPLLLASFLGLGAGRADAQTRLKLHTAKLPNGLEVIVLRDTSVPLATIEIAARNGSFTEPPELNGLSHLYEHMFFKGNRVIPDQETYLKRVRKLGIVFNATTGEEVVNYFFTLHKRRLTEGVEFMKNALLYPLFQLKELNKERKVVESEYDRAEARPHYHLQRAVGKKLWYKFWSRKNPLGERKVILTATQAQMRLIKRLYYQPANTALIVGGDVQPREVFRLARKYFGRWKGQPVKLPNINHPPLKRHQVALVDKPVKSATIFIALHGPDVKRDVAGTYAADVFSFVMRQRTSTFQKAMVRGGPALRASMTYVTRRHVGPIYVFVTAPSAKVLPALKKAVQLMQQWDRSAAFTDAEMQAAKTLLEVDDLYTREKTTSFCHTLSHWWSTAGLAYYQGYIANLKKVTRPQIVKFVRRYIKGRPMVVGILMDAATRAKLGITEDKVRNLLPRVSRVRR